MSFFNLTSVAITLYLENYPVGFRTMSVKRVLNLPPVSPFATVPLTTEEPSRKSHVYLRSRNSSDGERRCESYRFALFHIPF